MLVPCVLLLLPLAQTAFASVDVTLLSTVPPSSTVLAGIDIERAERSRAGSYIVQQTIADQDIAKLTKITGLDVRRDVRHLLFVGLGQHSARESAHITLAEGTFDPTRLVATGRSRGASRQQYRGTALLVQGAGNTAFAIAFPRAGVLLFGDLTTVRSIPASQDVSVHINPALINEINRIGSTSDMWFATLLSGSFLGEQTGDTLPPQLRDSDFLASITQSSGSLRFGQSDQMTLKLVARSVSDARMISGLLHVGGSLAHLAIGGSSGFSLAEKVLSSMQVTVQGTTVSATAAMPDDQLEQVLASGK